MEEAKNESVSETVYQMDFYRCLHLCDRRAWNDGHGKDYGICLKRSFEKCFSHEGQSEMTVLFLISRKDLVALMLEK